MRIVLAVELVKNVSGLLRQVEDNYFVLLPALDLGIVVARSRMIP